jgi:hypothetical protein
MPHGVSLDVGIDPPLADDASVQLALTMPTMGNMSAQATSAQRTRVSHFQASADLGMGGLWQVQLTVQRPGRPDVVARFRLNA